VRHLQGHIEAVRGISLSPEGGQLATASLDKIVKVSEVATGVATKVLQAHSAAQCGCAVEPGWGHARHRLMGQRYQAVGRVHSGRGACAERPHCVPQHSAMEPMWQPGGHRCAWHECEGVGGRHSGCSAGDAWPHLRRAWCGMEAVWWHAGVVFLGQWAQ
jgi:hypothetical protein